MPTTDPTGFTTSISPVVEDWVWTNSPNWSSHRLGANYLAIIEAQEGAPGGVQRDFLPQAKGKTGHVIRKLVPASPFELGSTDVTSGSKSATKFRTWGVVKSISRHSLEYYVCPNAKAAIDLAETIREQLPITEGAHAVYQRRIKAVQDRMERDRKELEELQAQARSIAGEGITIALERVDMDPDQAPADLKDLDEVVAVAQTPITPMPTHKLLAPPSPALPDDDDEEQELTAAQKAVLARMG